MTIEDIINDLENIDDSLTICAARTDRWTKKSEAELYEATKVPGDCRFPYFLEIAVAKDVLRAWSYLRGGIVPTLDKKCEAIIFYAEYDAYILPEFEKQEMRQP